MCILRVFGLILLGFFGFVFLKILQFIFKNESTEVNFEEQRYPILNCNFDLQFVLWNSSGI